MPPVLSLILIAIPAIIIIIEFAGFLITGHQTINKIIFFIVEVSSLILLPLLYANFGAKNDCCSEFTAVFSPDHQISIATVIVLCLIAYFYSRYRTNISTPGFEILTNSMLLIGIVLNLFIAIHTNEFLLTIFGNLPIVFLAILVLVKNHRTFIEQEKQNHYEDKKSFEKIAWKILLLPPLSKYPILLVLCLPVLAIISVVLLLVGQKPDSMIRAFTDTYKHGLSKWDFQCDNVNCGGHYLCSVAANGHQSIVKPIRLGKRNGQYIVCNRQLLISNAFEDLLQEYMPHFHRPIRKQYNKIGNLIHQHYHLFNNKFVSDVIYILMKPIEWSFLIVLYLFDRQPENRIAVQYTDKMAHQQD